MSFMGYIPIHVRHDVKLTPRDKVVYSEITANLNESGVCLKNNIHFAKHLGCTKTTISSAMTNLRQGKFIAVVIEKAEDSHKFIKRYIMPLPYTNLQGGGNSELQEAMLNLQGGGESLGADITTLNNADTPKSDEATINSIIYINSINKNKININEAINEKQMAFLEKIVNGFYKIKHEQMPKYISADWRKDMSLINGSINTIFELITIDKWKEDDVRNVIKWATNDSFWMSHLLSLKVLRTTSNNGLTKFANLHLRYKG
jgi:hypothetical protein